MGGEQLHVLFFPMLAHGHMIPTADISKLFASRGVKTTILTTPLNAPVFANTIEDSKHSTAGEIHLHLIEFPAAEAGLPQGCESIDKIASDLTLIPNFFLAISMLQPQLERALRDLRPNCLVADMFFPWATHVAAKFNIPRIVFHGLGFFAECASESMRLYKPFKNVISDSEQFILPNLPHEIRLVKTQVDHYVQEEPPTGFAKLLNEAKESERASYGVIFNSFYELEPDYVRHYREVLNKKAWHIGPVSYFNKVSGLERGTKSGIDEHQCLKWLNSKKPNSVIYVCFGSMSKLCTSQLHEIAAGLEASGQQFIWVVRKPENEEDEKWLDEGFEERMKDKGLVIRGWAPQVLILDHEAVGGFVTHCGWNSILEGVSAGVAMVTWPIFAEQFYNEKLVSEVLRTGVAVGAQQWNPSATDSGGIKSEAVEKAVKRIMVGEEAEEMRSRARALKEMARKAVEEGGSSYSDLSALIQELSSLHS